MSCFIKLRYFIAVFILFVVSCSKDNSDSLTNYISSDVYVANVVNVDELFRKAGVPLGPNSKLTIEQTQLLELATQSVMSDVLTHLIECGGIDTSEILLLSLNDRTNILGFRVADEDSVEKTMNAGGFASNSVMVGRLCFVGNTRAVVENYIKAVDNSSSEIMSKVKMSLGERKTIRSVFHVNINSIKWVSMNVNVTPDAISMEWDALDEQGQKVEFGEMFGEIDPSVLNFIPNDAVFAIAFGKPDFKNQLLNRLSTFQYNWIEDRIVGTTAISVSLGGSVDNIRIAGPEAFNIQVATTANESNSESLLEFLDNYFIGSKPQAGVRLANLYGCDLWYGIENGFMAVTFNRPFSANYSNALSSHFEGKRLACDLEIPFDSSLRKSLNLQAGVLLNLSMTADKLKARLRFTGSSQTAAVLLLNLGSDFVSFASLAPAMLF